MKLSFTINNNILKKCAISLAEFKVKFDYLTFSIVREVSFFIENKLKFQMDTGTADAD